MVRGRCLCGDVVYEIGGDLQPMSHCHCSMCRKTHGSAFATYVDGPASAFRWIEGRDRVRHYESSPGFVRGFCGTCGSVVPTEDEDAGLVYVPAGSLESDPGVRPASHIFVASKASWYAITDGLPQHAGYPAGSTSVTVEVPPRDGGSDGVVKGSCLCGAVTFEYEGEPKFMMNCHCSRCRYSRGAAHASNVFVEPASFRWTSGADHVVSYKLPEAERFGTAFCDRCGSLMPRHAPGAPLVNVPAGCLDGDPGVRPRGHIYVGSKAAWFEPTDDLPRHHESPGG